VQKLPAGWVPPDGSTPMVGGSYYSCTVSNRGGVLGTWFWSSTPPVVDNPAVVIQKVTQVVTQLHLTAPGIGMTPAVTKTSADSVGLVGLPNWLWVQNASATTFGPATGSTTGSGMTVTVTAKTRKVTWDLGDGSSPIVCTTAGTAYDPSYGIRPSPDCGRSAGYTNQGTHTVTARALWDIHYTSTVGISGDLTMELTNASSVVIGEAQVLGG